MISKGLQTVHSFLIRHLHLAEILLLKPPLQFRKLIIVSETYLDNSIVCEENRCSDCEILPSISWMCGQMCCLREKEIYFRQMRHFYLDFNVQSIK